jgi:hypothetical protein
MCKANFDLHVSRLQSRKERVNLLDLDVNGTTAFNSLSIIITVCTPCLQIPYTQYGIYLSAPCDSLNEHRLL